MVIQDVAGSAAALGSALGWAVGAILFRKLGDALSPLAMNLTKSVLGTLYLAALLFFFGFESVSQPHFLLLGASGLLGIAVGDSFFFKSLMYLGPRMTVLAEMLGPILTVFFAVLFLKEKISLLTGLGIVLTLGGVAWVLWEHAGEDKARILRWKGLQFSVLSGLCMSLAIILAKKALAETSALEATFIRLLWAAAGLALWGGLSRQLVQWIKPLSDPKLLRLAVLSAFVAIFGGFWLFLVALKYIDASVATVLNSTTPLFILPLSAFWQKEKISLRSAFGALAAVAGVALLVFQTHF